MDVFGGSPVVDVVVGDVDGLCDAGAGPADVVEGLVGVVGEGVWPCVLVVEGVSGGDAVTCGEEVGVGGEVGAVPVLLVDGVVVVGDWGVPVLALRRPGAV